MADKKNDGSLTTAVKTQQVSSAYLDLLKQCRDALAPEAKRLGEELAVRLLQTFAKMKFSPPFQGKKILHLNEAALIRAAISFVCPAGRVNLEV